MTTLPFLTPCKFPLGMQVVFNQTTKVYQEPTGIETRVPSFGSFDNFGAAGVYYTQNLTSAGYVPGQTLFAAPFDWRLPGFNQTAVLYPALQGLVEKVSAMNNGSKVVLMALSYGPQIVLSFLHRMTVAWKSQYIKWFVANSPVWSGAPVNMFLMIEGLNLTQTSPLWLGRDIILDIGGTLWLLPRNGTNATVTWLNDEVIISTPTRRYGAADMPRLLRDQGRSELAKAVEYVYADADLAQFAHPGVNTLVTYGYNLSTTATADFAEDFSPDQGDHFVPTVSSFNTTSGDGVVPLRSSLRSTVWGAEMAAAGYRLIHQSYINQYHATCTISTMDMSCRDNVLAIINN